MLSLCCHRPLPRRARSIAPPPCLLLPYGPACHRPVGWSIRSHEEDTRPVSPGPKDLERSHPRACGVLVSVVWTRAVCPKRPQVRVDVRRCEVSGCREVPSVGADLDGEGGAVGKVENHGLRRVHPPAILDLPILYGRYGFSNGRENRLQFVLGAGRADYLGVFSATRVLVVHPCSLGFLRTTYTFRHRASYPRLAVSPVLGPPSAVKLVTSGRRPTPPYTALGPTRHISGVYGLGCMVKAATLCNISRQREIPRRRAGLQRPRAFRHERGD